MDFPMRSAKERAAHYLQEAAKFRRMADTEDVGYIRVQLISVAEQYQRLARQPESRPATRVNARGDQRNASAMAATINPNVASQLTVPINSSVMRQCFPAGSDGA